MIKAVPPSSTMKKLSTTNKSDYMSNTRRSVRFEDSTSVAENDLKKKKSALKAQLFQKQQIRGAGQKKP